MTREELIKSYPKRKSTKFTLMYVLALIVALAIACLPAFTSNLINMVVVFVPLATSLVIALATLQVVLSSKVEVKISKWMTIDLKRYIKELGTETIPVKSYSVTENGVSVLLETDRTIKIMTVKDIEYVNTDRNYLEATWVEGLEDYNLPNGFYNNTLYLSTTQSSLKEG